MKHVFLWAEDCEAELTSELRSVFPGISITRSDAALLKAEFEAKADTGLPELAFARQWLPEPVFANADSIKTWSGAITEELKKRVPEGLPWRLHVEPHYGETTGHRMGARAWHSLRRSPQLRADQPSTPAVQPEAGRRRCDLIRSAVIETLRKNRRGLLRSLKDSTEPFAPDETFVQVLLSSPNQGYVSVAASPLPYTQRHLLSPFPEGRVVVAPDKLAPSRAFAKLVEAEIRLGQRIAAGETCVDLGAAPGSWTYVAVSRGARVLAVDRSPLRQDLMRDRKVVFIEHDAFTFTPRESVDWLLCDVIAEPDRSAALLLRWLREGWCRMFVVTLKLKAGQAEGPLAELRKNMPTLAGEWQVKKLCANKKEICVFGSR